MFNRFLNIKKRPLQTNTTSSSDESKLSRKTIVLNVFTKNIAKGIYCNLTSGIFVCVFGLIENYRVDL